MFKDNNKILGLIYVTISAILFSSKGVIIKTAYTEGVDAITFLMFRMLFSFPFYVIILIFYSSKVSAKPSNKQFGLVIFLGLSGYYLSSLFDFYGLEYVSAGLERLILFIYPTLTTLIGYFFFQKKVGKYIFYSLILTYIGIFGVVAYDVSTQGTEIVKGVIYILLCALVFAIYLVFSDDLVHIFGTIKFTCLVMIAASFGVFMQYFIEKNAIDLLQYSFKTYYLGFFLALFCTVIPTFLMNDGIKKIGASSTAVTATLGPVWTLILANIVLGEQIYAIQILGTSFVVGGIWLSYKDKS